MSNTLARNENKQSPQSSPRLPRRTLNSSSSSAASSSPPIPPLSSINTEHHYSVGGSSSSSSASSASAVVVLPPLPSTPVQSAATTAHTVNGNLQTHTNISINSSNTSSNLMQKNRLSMMSALSASNLTAGNIPAVRSTKALSVSPSSSMESIFCNALQPPPLPPRKSFHAISSTSSSSAAATSSTPSKELDKIAAKSNLNKNNSQKQINISNLAINQKVSKSSESLPTSENSVPNMTAPPIPRPLPQPPITIVEPTPSSSAKSEEDILLDDGVIVGPAETISGIIDTRPPDQRHPIMPTGNKSAPPLTSTNNLYQLKTNSNYNIQNNPNDTNCPYSQLSSDRHQRHQSVPVSNQQINPTPSKSSTTSQLSKPNVFCYENVNINLRKIENLSLKDCSNNNNNNNVPYENINLEYIARLMKEGYSKENVVTALGISRNNIEMACDILHEFVSKSGA